MSKLDELIHAAEQMDWYQIVLNHMYGPPCFYLEDGRFCGRAKTWFGHDGDPHHFVSFDDLLREVAREGKAGLDVGRRAGHKHRG